MLALTSLAILMCCSLSDFEPRAHKALSETTGVCNGGGVRWVEVAHKRLRYCTDSAIELHEYDVINTVVALEGLELWFEIQIPEPITYYHYSSHLLLERATGLKHPWVDPNGLEIHTTVPADRHELAHLAAAQLGRDSGLIAEGTAVKLEGNSRLGQLVRGLYRRGRLPPLETITDHAAFRNEKRDVAYITAGSFIDWLIRTHGKSKFLEFYGKDRSGIRLQDRIAKAYGRPLSALELDWLASLSGEKIEATDVLNGYLERTQVLSGSLSDCDIGLPVNEVVRGELRLTVCETGRVCRSSFVGPPVNSPIRRCIEDRSRHWRFQPVGLEIDLDFNITVRAQ